MAGRADCIQALPRVGSVPTDEPPDKTDVKCKDTMHDANCSLAGHSPGAFNEECPAPAAESGTTFVP